MPLFGLPNVEKMCLKRDLPGLIKALSNPKDTHLRSQAASALGKLADPSAEEPLIHPITNQGI